MLQDNPAFETLQDSYWSGIQKGLKPLLSFQPRSAAELAQAVTRSVKAQSAFATKSGGHGHISGVSCSDGGIQFDLTKLNGITINREASTVTVGTGNTWRVVYDTLQSQGLMAVGGRSADVGVGGFLLGGVWRLPFLSSNMPNNAS